jgi:hypothetical protein
MPTRRSAIQLLALGGASVLLEGCSPRRSPVTPAARPTGRALARVLVSPDRVIRQVAGLRPFRRSGFNVSVAKIGDKPVIHNYGHGGGGITLSWGTAQLVVEHAVATPHRDAAVIEVDYLTFAPGDFYMMPRRDGIVLGGTSERDVWSLEPDPAHADRILKGHQELFGKTWKQS